MIQLLEIKNSDVSIRSIEKRLGSLHKDAPVVLKIAINETAKKTKTLMAREAKKKYVMKSADFKRRIQIKRATANKPMAVVSSKGRPTNLIDHKVSPYKMQAGKSAPSILKAKVLKKSKMKPLEKGGIKAFLIEFINSQKIGVVRREGKERYPLKTYHSPAIPQMLGSESVMKGVQPQVGDILQKEIVRQIDRRIRKEMYVK